MAQIIPPNVLQEQTAIVGPQYAERLIHHKPPRRPPAAPSPHLLEQVPAWRSRGADQQTSRLRIIPYWFAGI